MTMQAARKDVTRMRNSGCSPENRCGRAQPKKPVSIDFLYLDTTVCGRCRDTEAALDEAVLGVSGALGAAWYEVGVNKVNIATRELAVEYRFVSSPTIRVNGNDISAELRESVCEDCGTLCGDAVDCRVWVYGGAEYTAPPKELIADAILREVYGAKQSEPEREAYRLPENLENYFSARARKNEKELSAMKKMKIFEPAMCCPTGLCGVGVDPELLRVSAALETLKKQGVAVDRFNLNSAPAEFITDQKINAYISEKGAEGLPAVTVDGRIAIAGRYPTNEEFAKLLGLPEDAAGKKSKPVTARIARKSGGCNCKGGCC